MDEVKVKNKIYLRKTRKRNVSYQTLCLLDILEFKPCGIFVHMCLLIYKFINRTEESNGYMYTKMGREQWEQFILEVRNIYN